LSVDDLVERLRLWHADVPQWRAHAVAAGCVIRHRSWDEMAQEIVRIVEHP
jgi:hypothetical protein